LVPNLGIVKYGDYQSFVMADIPGLIEGAHMGKGLGDQFLRHIERTKILVFIIDVNDEDIAKSFHLLLKELIKFNDALAHKPRIVCINKMDTVDKDNYHPDFFLDERILYISAAARFHLDALVRAIAYNLEEEQT
jgi:GTP-binding protein